MNNGFSIIKRGKHYVKQAHDFSVSLGAFPVPKNAAYGRVSDINNKNSDILFYVDDFRQFERRTNILSLHVIRLSRNPRDGYVMFDEGWNINSDTSQYIVNEMFGKLDMDKYPVHQLGVKKYAHDVMPREKTNPIDKSQRAWGKALSNGKYDPNADVMGPMSHGDPCDTYGIHPIFTDDWKHGEIGKYIQERGKKQNPKGNKTVYVIGEQKKRTTHMTQAEAYDAKLQVQLNQAVNDDFKFVVMRDRIVMRKFVKDKNLGKKTWQEVCTMPRVTSDMGSMEYDRVIFAAQRYI